MKRKSKPAEDSNALLDLIRSRLRLNTDAALSRALEVAPPVISKMRNQKLAVGPSILLRMHEETGIPISQLKSKIQVHTESERD